MKDALDRDDDVLPYPYIGEVGNSWVGLMVRVYERVVHPPMRIIEYIPSGGMPSADLILELPKGSPPISKYQRLIFLRKDGYKECIEYKIDSDIQVEILKPTKD